jgi:membrane protease YdiL (CAAX protease family)
MDQAASIADDKPTWRRIVDFPLVAMVISVALFLVTVAVAATISNHLLPRVPGFTAPMSFDIVCAVLLILLYKLVIRRLGEHRRDDLRLTGALRPLVIGLGAGLAVFTLIVIVAAALGVYRLTGEGDASDLLPQLILTAIFPAISEEMLFRGILFRWIEEFGGSWAALLLTSAFFGAAHLANPNASPIAAVGIAFEAGVMLGAAYMLTRSLWLPMGLHAAWNFTQGEIYDIPVSGTPVHGLLVARLKGPPLLTGNGFGLEASLIAIVIATLFGLWLLWLAIRKGELVKPWWARRRLARVATS